MQANTSVASCILVTLIVERVPGLAWPGGAISHPGPRVVGIHFLATHIVDWGAGIFAQESKVESATLLCFDPC